MIMEKNYIDQNILFILKSEIRLRILTELNIQPQTIKDIVKNTDLAYSTVSNNLKKMEYKNHVKKQNRVYELNPLTKIYFNQLIEFKKSIEVVRNFDSLWDKHDLTYLNNESIQNITELYESKLIETNPTDIYKTHDTVKKQLDKSESVKGILPYIHPDYPILIEKILKNKGDIELIMQRDIYKKMISQVDDKLKKKSIKNDKLRVYFINNNIDIYLLICDNNMNLGLFKNDGSYDQNRILNSNTSESLKWADNLFETIKQRVI